MHRCLCIALMVLSVAGGAIRTLGHHSLFAEFDMKKPVKLTGTISQVDWGNPHALLFLDVASGAKAKALTWVVQLPGPNTFARNGWRREPFRYGIVVTVSGYASKDGSRQAAALDVMASDGRKLFSAVTNPGE